jgi:Ca2+-dependent lipid-binding protein
MNQSNATSSSSSSNSSNNVSTRHTANASFPFSFVLPDDTEESSTSSSNTIGRILTRSLTKLHQQQLDSKTHKLPPVTYQKIMTKEKPCNIINILESSRLTGRMPRLISDVISFIFCFFIFKKISIRIFFVYFIRKVSRQDPAADQSTA